MAFVSDGTSVISSLLFCVVDSVDSVLDGNSDSTGVSPFCRTVSDFAFECRHNFHNEYTSGLYNNTFRYFHT